MSDHLAKEAARLKNDDLFNKALDAIRSEALEALAETDADEIIMILRQQQKVKVIDEIRNVLDRYIMAADVQENAGSFV